MLWGSILMEEDKYSALKWKKSYFTICTNFHRLQESFREVSNGISNDQRAAVLAYWRDGQGRQRKQVTGAAVTGRHHSSSV